MNGWCWCDLRLRDTLNNIKIPFETHMKEQVIWHSINSFRKKCCTRKKYALIDLWKICKRNLFLCTSTDCSKSAPFRDNLLLPLLKGLFSFKAYIFQCQNDIYFLMSAVKKFFCISLEDMFSWIFKRDQKSFEKKLFNILVVRSLQWKLGEQDKVFL